MFFMHIFGKESPSGRAKLHISDFLNKTLRTLSHDGQDLLTLIRYDTNTSSQIKKSHKNNW